MKTFNLILLLTCLISSAYPKKLKSMEFMLSISGKQIIAGQHNREPNSEPSRWTDSIYITTGKYPALWSGDFLMEAADIENRWTMIREAKKQWEKGAVVQLMLHTCPPATGEPCKYEGGVLSKLTDMQWKELLTDGTELNQNWKKRLDEIAVFLIYLKDNGVEVLFRPLHEMNQKLFWWGGRPGPDGTAKLYRITHDYLTLTKGLDNLIWVWDMQDIDKTWAEYNPGEPYWDILAFDIYENGYNKDWYEYAKSIAGNKPIAIGECSRLPSLDLLKSQQRYVFFMAWSELVYRDNTDQKIKTLYDSPDVITLDEMPGWKE